MKNSENNFKNGEYEGTIIIDRSGIFECNNAIFWSKNKNAIEVKASGVTIKNARIEADGGFAIKTDFSDLILQNVEIKGNIYGLSKDFENIKIPGIIALGDFPAERENVFSFEIEVPADCTIENNLYGVEISPLYLKKGINIIKIKIAPMKKNTVLYGEIFLKSFIIQRIFISGKASEISAKILKKGQRINIDEYSGNILKFVLSRKNLKRNMDIDGYVFLLGENGKAFCDNDLIFFGNPVSDDNSIKINENEISVNLSILQEKYQKIAVCFAIYSEEDDSLNFSMVDSPAINIFSNSDKIFSFSLENLSSEKTVVCTEIYRYKNQWKLNCIGSGYNQGLRKLCENYGIDVED